MVASEIENTLKKLGAKIKLEGNVMTFTIPDRADLVDAVADDLGAVDLGGVGIKTCCNTDDNHDAGSSSGSDTVGSADLLASEDEDEDDENDHPTNLPSFQNLDSFDDDDFLQSQDCLF